MAIGKFHSFRGEKSALIMVKANAFVVNPTAVYVPKDALPADIKAGDTITIPDGYSIVDFVDPTSGEVRVTKDGQPLKVLQY